MIESKYNINELIGKRYGSRVITASAGKIDNSYAVEVKCDCGDISAVPISRLLYDRQTGCVACHNKNQIGPNNRAWRGGLYVSMTAFNKWKKSAAKRRLLWDLSIECLDSVIEAQDFKCLFTGDNLEINHGYRNNGGGNASLDRIDNDLGYIPGNVQFVTKDINFAKQRLSVSEFIELCQKVVDHAKRQI